MRFITNVERSPILLSLYGLRSGKDGDDVPLYLEKQLAQLLAELEELTEKEDS
ncbi:MAG: hypothetical protein RMY34_11950 [Aulosira sp. DedQUE10]|nr:hypothetical protein [Aulosira sp. DedQUE10]